jgi:hypothetical protein
VSVPASVSMHNFIVLRSPLPKNTSSAGAIHNAFEETAHLERTSHPRMGQFESARI